MNVIKKRESSFTQVSNSFLRDNNVSFKAKGLFCYMFSMADGWNFTIKSMASQQKDGEASVKSALDELKEFGYISYEKHTDGSGTYFLNDEPNVENPNVENPKMGKPPRIKNTQLSKNKNTQSQLIAELIKSGEVLTDTGKELLEDFISYRKRIKKPIKTTAPLKAHINTLRQLLKEKLDIHNAISIMKEREWQTLKVEWVQNMQKNNVASDMKNNFITTEIKGY